MTITLDDGIAFARNYLALQEASMQQAFARFLAAQRGTPPRALPAAAEIQALATPGLELSCARYATKKEADGSFTLASTTPVLMLVTRHATMRGNVVTFVVSNTSGERDTWYGFRFYVERNPAGALKIIGFTGACTPCMTTGRSQSGIGKCGACKGTGWAKAPSPRKRFYEVGPVVEVARFVAPGPAEHRAHYDALGLSEAFAASSSSSSSSSPASQPSPPPPWSPPQAPQPS